MDTFGKMVLSGSVWAWYPLVIFLHIPTSLLDQVLVCLLAPGFIAHQGPYFCQIKLDFTLCTKIDHFLAFRRKATRLTTSWPSGGRQKFNWGRGRKHTFWYMFVWHDLWIQQWLLTPLEPHNWARSWIEGGSILCLLKGRQSWSAEASFLQSRCYRLW